MTTATVPTIEVHGNPALRKMGIAALFALLAAIGAKGIYELVDVLDGPGARVATVPAETVYDMRFGSADAADHWATVVPAAPEVMGSADATEHWAGR